MAMMRDARDWVTGRHRQAARFVELCRGPSRHLREGKMAVRGTGLASAKPQLRVVARSPAESGRFVSSVSCPAFYPPTKKHRQSERGDKPVPVRSVIEPRLHLNWFQDHSGMRLQ